MRAIILAAGMGTRLRPLTENTPKGLVKVNGIPMVEKEVIFLKEKGIDEIIIVTGYLAEQFEYLKEQYGVTLIHNDKYDVYNNLYTMNLVKDYLKDAYVLESDLYMNKNVIDTTIDKTTYFGVREQDFKNEWVLSFDENNKMESIVVGDAEDDIIFRGISYWCEKDGQLIAKKIEEAINERDFTDLYWDAIVCENVPNMDIYFRELNTDDVFEIDNVNDLEKAEQLICCCC